MRWSTRAKEFKDQSKNVTEDVLARGTGLPTEDPRELFKGYGLGLDLRTRTRVGVRLDGSVGGGYSSYLCEE
jgi:hypothetical protein